MAKKKTQLPDSDASTSRIRVSGKPTAKSAKSRPGRRRKASSSPTEAMAGSGSVGLESSPAVLGQTSVSQVVQDGTAEGSFDARTSLPSAAPWASFWASVLVVGVLTVALFVGFQFVYAGRVLPGVRAEGIYLGGLTSQQAVSRLQAMTAKYQETDLSLNYSDTTLRLGVGQLAPSYTPQADVEAALAYGRQGSWTDGLYQQARALFGRYTNVSTVRLDSTRLTPYLTQLDAELNRAVSNASLDFAAGSVVVTPAVPGRRVDTGILASAIYQRLQQSSNAPIQVPYYRLAPQIETSEVDALRDQAARYVGGPLTLKTAGEPVSVPSTTIISWFHLSSTQEQTVFQATPPLVDWYELSSATSLTIDPAKLASYVSGLSATTDRLARNAALGASSGKVVIISASQDGASLDQPAAARLITETLSRGTGDRVATLPIVTTKAEINESSLADLGLNDLLSEGVTYFPGSPSTRLINVRAGANHFNGILLKPDEVFSFGTLLGAVGPEQGYVPELVILNNHEEKQYGGGLCQVSSTAYRAALLAGLPILERHNHSFAISYYTNPYGVPGVDATIYYPPVDLKFKNDTGHYLLIQTYMQGTTLKFDYYGTKNKSGVIRGPFFVTGTSDVTKPSHTVFYRDVLDLAGNVTKTNEVHTWYQSSLDFPVTHEFN
jgi:vancomycin resistance protein YoaR